MKVQPGDHANCRRDFITGKCADNHCGYCGAASNLAECPNGCYSGTRPVGLDDFAAEIVHHVEDKFGAEPFTQVAKVAEEAGEAIGAALKYEQACGPKSAIANELIDTIIAALAALYLNGCEQPWHSINQRWQEVKKR